MTKEQQTIWTTKLAALEEKISELKKDAAGDFPRIVGSHPIVFALAAMEGMAWGTKDAISRFPTDEQISQPDLL